MSLEKKLRAVIRNVPDFPKEGILFRDITPLLAEASLMNEVIEALVQAAPKGITHVAAIEARGFLFAVAVAIKLGVPFVPIRKKGKLPFDTLKEEYDLEYGTDAIYMHKDAMKKGSNVYLIDDLIATGGTLAASITLVEKAQSTVSKIGCVIELADLKGKDRFADVSFSALSTIIEI